MCLFLSEAQCLELQYAFDLLHQTLVTKHSRLQEASFLEPHHCSVTQVATSQALPALSVSHAWSQMELHDQGNSTLSLSWGRCVQRPWG